ncbi:hypothetical protein GQ457_06G015720 [Hibiscus cannabinus]
MFVADEFQLGPRPFKWFNYLADDKDYVKCIENVCLDSRGLGIGNIMKNCKRVSKDCVSNLAGESNVRIKEVEGIYELLEHKLDGGIVDSLIVSDLKEARGKLWALIRREFLVKEIWEALMVLDSSKATIPDVFNMGFLKKFWSSLKVEILNFFGCFFKCEISDLLFNQSFVVLIPKRSNPVLIEDYRPISFVGCIYKVFSKVLALRLREVMDAVIEDQRFAFCPGRHILDCSLIENELIDHHKRKKLEGVIFKADFYKAYDTIG